MLHAVVELPGYREHAFALEIFGKLMADGDIRELAEEHIQSLFGVEAPWRLAPCFAAAKALSG
jgi:hypothetical protein